MKSIPHQSSESILGIIRRGKVRLNHYPVVAVDSTPLPPLHLDHGISLTIEGTSPVVLRFDEPSTIVVEVAVQAGAGILFFPQFDSPHTPLTHRKDSGIDIVTVGEIEVDVTVMYNE